MSSEPGLPRQPKVVNLGTHVELEFICESGLERLALDIVEDKSADYTHGFLGTGTPLAKAILGQPAGKTIPYRQWDIRAIKILAVSFSQNQTAAEIAEKRQAAMTKALREVDRANAINFASSFSGKWGDYDPDNLKEDW